MDVGQRGESGPKPTTLVVPEPRDGSLLALQEVLAQLPALREECLHRGDLATAEEIRRRCDAMATYVGNRKGKKDVLAETRRTEVLIGKLLGPGVPGRHASSESIRRIDEDHRVFFRRMAAWEPVVEEMIAAGKPERNAILIEIEERERQEKRSANGEQPTCDLRHGDFRMVLADLSDIDAVITDPPYEREALPLYADLAIWAANRLRPGGILAVMSGNYHLPEVYRLLGEGGLPYRWTLSYQVTGEAIRNHPANVASMWKPVILYGGTDIALGSDVVKSERNDKAHHEWGQSVSGMANLIERLTRPGWHVVDPFMGAGTTAIAALAVGRSFTGAEIDEQFWRKARERLE